MDTLPVAPEREVSVLFDLLRWAVAVTAHPLPRARAVALVLIAEANVAGEVFIARDALVALTGRCLSSVKRATAELEREGLLRRRLRFDARGGAVRNGYVLTLPEGGAP